MQYSKEQWESFTDDSGKHIFKVRGVSKDVAEARPYIPFAKDDIETVYANDGGDGAPEYTVTADVTDDLLPVCTVTPKPGSGVPKYQVILAHEVVVEREAYTRKDGRKVRAKTYTRHVPDRIVIVDPYAGGDFGRIPPTQRNAVYGKIVRQSRGFKMMKHRVPLPDLSRILPQLRSTQKDVYLDVQKVHCHDGMEHTAGGCVCGGDHPENWKQKPLTDRERRSHVNGKKHHGQDRDDIHPNNSPVPYAFSPDPYITEEDHVHNPRTSEGHWATLHKDDIKPIGDRSHTHPTGFPHQHKPDMPPSHLRNWKHAREALVLDWVVVPRTKADRERAKRMPGDKLSGHLEQLGPWHFHAKPKKLHLNYDKRLDLHPEAAKRLKSADVVYFALEGVLKADSIISARGCAFDVPSVTLWDAPELADFADEYLRRKVVVVVPDSDWASNPAVSLEAFSARRFLKQKRFGIKEVYIAAAWPTCAEKATDVCRHGPDGTPEPDHKRGVDDFLGERTSNRSRRFQLGDLLTVERKQRRAMTRWATDFIKERTNPELPDAARLDPRTAKRMADFVQWLALVADENGRVEMRGQSLAKYFGASKNSIKKYVEWIRTATIMHRLGADEEPPIAVDTVLVWEANYVTGVEEWRELPVITVRDGLRARTDRRRLGDFVIT